MAAAFNQTIAAYYHGTRIVAVTGDGPAYEVSDSGEQHALEPTLSAEALHASLLPYSPLQPTAQAINAVSCADY